MTTEDVSVQTSVNVMTWAKFCSSILEDSVSAILGFIPNGLNNLYDSFLKSMPYLGEFFQQRSIEEGIKFITGIKIGQTLAHDTARFLFKPIGFGVGAFIGSSRLADKGFKLNYDNQVSRALDSVSAQTVGCALLAAAAVSLIQFFKPDLAIKFDDYMVVTLAGGLVGLMYRIMMLGVVHTVTAANSASTRMNADRAKKFSSQLKIECKSKVRDKIKVYAKEIIIQINGEITEALDDFFDIHLENVAHSLDNKIDRHLNLLTHKAVHGDFKALKKLAALYPKKGKTKKELDVFLERVFNKRAIQHIKNAADTYYDAWHYRHLKMLPSDSHSLVLT